MGAEIRRTWPASISVPHDLGGWPVLLSSGLRQGQGKHPRTTKGFKAASCDKTQIEKWFSPKAALSNVGIVTGEISNLTVLDIDTSEGKLGAQSWQQLIADKGEPLTLMARTGSGGMHVLFLYNSALRTGTNVLGKGIDCRNDGGYIVASPSRHRSGRTYEWENWGTPLCALPAHLSKKPETRGRPRKDDPRRQHYSLAEVTEMLAAIPADDRDLWRHVGIILGRTFNRSDEAWTVYVEWADTWGGKKGRDHDKTMRAAFYDISQQQAESELSLGTIVKAALDHGWVPKKGQVPIGQFVYYGPKNNFIYRPTKSEWIASAVDIAVSPVNVDSKLVKASAWIQEYQLVTSITCDPALNEDYVKGFDYRDGETIAVPGAALFNTYRKPTIELGDAKKAVPFQDHVSRLMPKVGDADQFFDFMAHLRQKPWEKPRFALLIAGGQGIGKDTAVEFCCPAIGPWNVANIDPAAFDSAFNEYAAATLVRISETSNLHEMSKWAFNERTKVLIAGTPDTCSVNPKYGQKYQVKMHCGVILTTNNLASGIVIPQDDRRYDVIDCATLEEMKLADDAERRNYFATLWQWFLNGGATHVAAFLQERNLTKFSASNGQRKTAAHRDVVQANLASDYWLDDLLDFLGYPSLVRADWLIDRAVAMGEKKGDVYRKFGPTMGRAGYVMYRNPSDKDGRWKINGRGRFIWAKVGTPIGLDATKECADDRVPIWFKGF